jgi:hypothetical protein
LRSQAGNLAFQAFHFCDRSHFGSDGRGDLDLQIFQFLYHFSTFQNEEQKSNGNHQHHYTPAGLALVWIKSLEQLRPCVKDTSAAGWLWRYGRRRSLLATERSQRCVLGASVHLGLLIGADRIEPITGSARERASGVGGSALEHL